MSDKFFFGEGSLNKLPALLDQHKSKRIFLVTGKSSYEDFGTKSRIDSMLQGKEVFHYSDFNQNPQLEDLLKGIELFHAFKPGIIIAIGGGSVIDTAKLLSVLSAEKETIKNIIKDKLPVPKRKISFIVIPTTSGSGSEATHFAVVYLDKKKYSIYEQSLIADNLILDPELTYSMPQKLTAVSAFDAFSQAVESYWAVGSTLKSRQYAAESIRIIIKIYDQLITKPDKKVRRMMMKAAHLSGKAINISKTTAPHALSYFLTQNFNIPHGLAVMLLLPAFFNYNAKAKQTDLKPKVRFYEYVNRIKDLKEEMGVISDSEAVNVIKQMIMMSNFNLRLRTYGINNSTDIELAARNVNIERLDNNPVVLSKEQLILLLKSVW